MDEKHIFLVIQFIIIAVIIRNLVLNKKYIESDKFKDESHKLIGSFMINIISYDNPIKFFISPFLNM
jgi:hypothetical protein